MPYIGRELDRGNYLKLDDISSSFNNSLTTFNLTNGGKAFYPGSAFSILVVLAGVVQEPETAYQINQAQITFASAPLAGDQFFCIALGVALGVNTPANGSVNGTQLAKPFNYDGYFYLDDTNNRVGIATATPQKPLHVVGEGQFDSVRVLGDLTVDGTTTTLDTVVTEVDKLEVGANNNTVGVAITQSGSGDAATFEGGNVGIGTNNAAQKLHVSGGTGTNIQVQQSNGNLYLGSSGSTRFGLASGANIIQSAAADFGIGSQSGHNLIFGTNNAERFRITDQGDFLVQWNNNNFLGSYYDADYYMGLSFGANRRELYIDNRSNDTRADIVFRTVLGQSDPTEKLRITSGGNIGIGNTDTPQSLLEVFGTSPIVRSKHSTSQKYTQINHDGTDGYVDWSSGGLILRGASNAERLRISSGGYVGINDANPTQQLSVHDDTNYQGILINGNSAPRLNFAKSNSATVEWGVGIDGTNGNNFAIAQAGNTAKFIIDANGKIGIGDNTPDNTLSIKGLGSFDADSNSFYFGSNFTGTGQNYIGSSKHAQRFFLNNASANGYFSYSNTGSAGTAGNAITWQERFRITSTGYVGINETTPSNRLHVKETNSNTIVGKLESSVAYSYLSIEDNSTTTGNVRVGAHGNDFVINAGAVQRLRISSTGSVTIGSGNDDSSMPEFGSNTGGLTIDDVGGSNTGLRLSHGNDDTYLVQAGNGNFYVAQFGTGSMRFGVGSSGQERLRITSGGNLQVKGGNLHLDSNAELALFEDNTSGTYTNSAKIAFDFSGNVARMRSSVNGSASLRDLAFYTANTAAIYIKTDANVGIGENAPNNRLHIVKDNNVSYTPDQATQNPNNQLKIENHSTTADSFVSMAMRARACDFHLGVKNNGADNSGRLFLVHQDTTNKEVVSVLSTGSVGISSATPKTDVDISQKTGAVALPQGTTAQRPTGSAPYIRKNTTNNALEFYNGTEWVEIITDYFPTGSTILG